MLSVEIGGRHLLSGPHSLHLGFLFQSGFILPASGNSSGSPVYCRSGCRAFSCLQSPAVTYLVFIQHESAASRFPGPFRPISTSSLSRKNRIKARRLFQKVKATQSGSMSISSLAPKERTLQKAPHQGRPWTGEMHRRCPEAVSSLSSSKPF